MRSLYLSHIGMVEPLGQSQVLPYLIGLARRGADIEIFSFETAKTTDAQIEALRARLDSERIAWRPLRRSPSHALGRKFFEASEGVFRGLASALSRRPDIVHGRSYLPSAMADAIATLVPRAKLLFDCRGMLADEYLDGGNWTREDLRFRLVKQYERRLFRRTDGLVILTHALHRWLREQDVLGERTQVEVIPCCVDTDRFIRDEAGATRVRAELGLGDRPVVVYSGTLGTWYLEREMARFFAHYRRHVPSAVFLVLTRDDISGLRSAARDLHVPDDAIVSRAFASADMPAALSTADLGLSFIKPCFSKVGSSPTKVAEYLACGLAVALNDGIGDQADLAAHPGACITFTALDDATLQDAAARAAALLATPREETRQTARRLAVSAFSLNDFGVSRYQSLYQRLLS